MHLDIPFLKRPGTACYIWLLCHVLLFNVLQSKAQNQPIVLSDSASISLLTVSPGSELYAAFGHSGIRVTDFKQGIDVVFNYGTFDFNQPNFYSNFVQGRLNYMLSVDRHNDFIGMYIYEKRSVIEDELNLTAEEKKQVFTFLYNNATPENRDYRYEFFFDNCATRIRDVFEKSIGKRLQLNYTQDFQKKASLRDMLDLYVNNSKWVKLGFYLILGTPCDIEATPRMQTFLPDYLRTSFAKGTVIHQNDLPEPFVLSTTQVLKFPLEQQSSFFTSPEFIFPVILLLLLLLGWLQLRRGKYNKYFDLAWLLLYGIFGVFFLGMWFGTEHYSVEKNLNMLWAIPLYLPLSVAIPFIRSQQFYQKLFTLIAAAMLLLLSIHFFLPQPYHPVCLMLIIFAALRSIMVAHFLKTQYAD
jgi:hypothetical protein